MWKKSSRDVQNHHSVLIYYHIIWQIYISNQLAMMIKITCILTRQNRLVVIVKTAYIGRCENRNDVSRGLFFYRYCGFRHKCALSRISSAKQTNWDSNSSRKLPHRRLCFLVVHIQTTLYWPKEWIGHSSCHFINRKLSWSLNMATSYFLRSGCANMSNMSLNKWYGKGPAVRLWASQTPYFRFLWRWGSESCSHLVEQVLDNFFDMYKLLLPEVIFENPTAQEIGLIFRQPAGVAPAKTYSSKMLKCHAALAWNTIWSLIFEQLKPSPKSSFIKFAQFTHST